MKFCLLFLFHWILRFSWSSPKISRIHNCQNKGRTEAEFLYGIRREEWQLKHGFTREDFGHPFPSLAVVSQHGSPSALQARSEGSLISLPEDTCWQQGDRGEPEESWKCLSLPFPEAPVEAIITFFSRWKISFFPSFRTEVTIFYTSWFLQYHVLLPWVYQNQKFKNVYLEIPCSHYLCILSTEQEFWCKGQSGGQVNFCVKFVLYATGIDIQASKVNSRS